MGLSARVILSLIFIFVCQAGGATNPQVDDDFQLFQGYDAWAAGVAFTQHGNIIVVGGGVDSKNKRHWVVRMKTPNSIWRTVDLNNTQVGSHADSVAVDTDGTIYVAGVEYLDETSDNFILRRSTDEGLTWQTFNQFPYKDAVSVRLHVQHGIIFEQLTVDESIGFSRVTLDKGKTWSTSPTLNYDSSNHSLMTPQDEIYSLGGVIKPNSDPNNNYFVTTQFSLDGGLTWSKNEDEVLSGDPDDLASDTSGKILYMVDSERESLKVPEHLILYKTTDRGTHWKVMDDYLDPKHPMWNRAKALSIGSANEIFIGSIVGTEAGHNGSGTWFNTSCVIRKGSPDGKSWKTIDEFQEPCSISQMANFQDRLIYSGQYWDERKITHWYTRIVSEQIP